ncbi:ABC transporter ATP-binding protein [uncultured Methylobacterium sp.]|jgi:spermidine/putrescine transport system ATP-binding protein|uniref:ABC transporter ATP-binding protein n=1 Tax=uncultured Methylobacterium sp. TaxID=157278 RepID=UPI00262F4B01|nr:ABC transporter ATP-binding protein [uncultured Methylobacterium sp.]
MAASSQPSSDAVGVDLRAVRKWYGPVQAVRDVSLAIRPGEIVSLLGPSGCGKTTTLRMIAGLEHPDAGEIRIGGVLVNAVAPWKRNIGMVFQNYALFPHMSVAENVAFGLAMRREGRAAIDAKVAAAMAQVRLAHLADRRPSQLSGGQRQRVALARAIVTRPSVLLLDEPLAALDRKLREQMQVEIKQLQREVGITTVFVTHDQEEALTLSDRIVVMEEGRVVQTGTPSEVYERPRSRFVSDFIGFTNAVRGRVEAVEAGTATVAMGSGQTIRVPAEADIAPAQAVDLVVRPEKVEVNPPEGARPGRAVIAGTLRHSVYTGAVTYHHVDIGGGETLIAMTPNGDGHAGQPALGSPVTLGVRPETVLVFARAG